MIGKMMSGTPAPRLGDLELAVMDVLWRCERVDAKSVSAAVAERALALSTIQSTLERLHRKRLIKRQKQGRAYVYEPAVTRSQLIGLLIREVAQQVASGQMEPVLSGFVDLVENDDPDTMDQLERMLVARRGRVDADG